MFEPWQYVVIAVMGGVAGVLGGMLGVGGSTIMIPALVVLFGQTARDGFNQHLYQASAMIVNLAVVIPAAIRHRRAGAVQFDTLKLILPAALLFIFAGVWLSNRFEGEAGAVWLGRVLAVFLVYVIIVNVQRLVRGRNENGGDAIVDWPRGSLIGGAMGMVAGLMGIGGGAVAVPLQQTIMRLPLRNCIANSTLIICVTAGFGAIYKNATLASHGVDWRVSLTIAGLLAPTAIIGGFIGGKLTHSLPLRTVRGAFVVLLLFAAWKMAAI